MLLTLFVLSKKCPWVLCCASSLLLASCRSVGADKQLVQGPACVWKEWLPFATAEIIEHQRHAEANHARMIMGLSMDVMHPYLVHLSLTFELITWLTLT